MNIIDDSVQILNFDDVANISFLSMMQFRVRKDDRIGRGTSTMIDRELELLIDVIYSTVKDDVASPLDIDIITRRSIERYADLRPLSILGS